MKIHELNLAAFGPFTERSLQFDLGVGDLHIVYGPNEAGKSSSLRGLKALLFGIEARTNDNFLHANDKLRIHGRLLRFDDSQLTFVRRKGNKNTLLNPDGTPLDDQALAPYLTGVNAQLFESLFGIDHPALVRGGQEILEQRGEVGQALFSAALGSQALHSVIQELEGEADSLFRPRGSTPAINAALRTYADLNRHIREQSQSARIWDEKRRALYETMQAQQDLHKELARKRREINRLQRIQRVLPKFARHQELRKELQAMGEVLLLPEDFPERRRAVLSELKDIQLLLEINKNNFKQLQDKVKKFPESREWLNHDTGIEALHSRLHSQKEAKLEQPKLKAEHNQLQTDIKKLFTEVLPKRSPEDMGALRLVFLRRQRIKDLGKTHPGLLAELKQIRKSLRETQGLLEQARKAQAKLPEAMPSKPLRLLVSSARKSGDLDTSLQSSLRKLKAIQNQCITKLSCLGFWEGPLEQIVSLAVPSRDSLNRYENAYAELKQDIRHSREKQTEFTDALSGFTQKLDQIRLAGSVPTEQDLEGIREERDLAWRLVRGQWLDGQDTREEARSLDPARPLAEAFEYRVKGADELADRLRREAAQVHNLAQLRSESEQNRERLKTLSLQLTEFERQRQELDRNWRALWAPSGIEPHSPREMRAWLESLEQLRTKVEDWQIREQQYRDTEKERDAHILKLQQGLKVLGMEAEDDSCLEAILIEAEATLELLEEQQRDRLNLAKNINELEIKSNILNEKMNDATQELNEWTEHWKQALEGLDLPSQATPGEVTELLEKIGELFNKQEAAEKLDKRLQSLDEEQRNFQQLTDGLIKQIAPELIGSPVEEAVARLNVSLTEARQRESRRKQIQDHMDQLTDEIQDLEIKTQIMDQRLDELYKEAKQESTSGLEEGERLSETYRRLGEGIHTLEQDILEAGEGSSMEQLEQEAAAIEADELSGRIDALLHEIEDELEPKRTDLAQRKGREEKEMELMDGGDQAARTADEAQACLARIRADAERYVQRRLAAKVLRDEVERYRQENQGPLVKRAGEHFAALTCGSFAGLMADFDEKDQPVLVGKRPNGGQVRVEGMSAGTRDQLYLALRLASLEKYMESSEPMPFIVDDILVDFDDARSKAALQALSELAGKTQVILFTHHSQVVEQAKALQGTTPAQIHQL